MKRSPLGVGQKSLDRGSTFAAMDRQAWGRSPHANPGDDDYVAPKRRPRVAMGASPPQVTKRRRIGACIVTGATEGVDSAHLWDRSLGGCNSADCIVPLRRDVHELYDRHEFDLLPYLVAAGCVVELQHALEHARGDLVGLLNRLTGERWVPERAAAA